MALANVMVSTEGLFELYHEYRPEAIETETIYTVRITHDWTSHYERLLTIKVSGKRPLVEWGVPRRAGCLVAGDGRRMRTLRDRIFALAGGARQRPGASCRGVVGRRDELAGAER